MRKRENRKMGKRIRILPVCAALLIMLAGCRKDAVNLSGLQSDDEGGGEAMTLETTSDTTDAGYSVGETSATSADTTAAPSGSRQDSSAPASSGASGLQENPSASSTEPAGSLRSPDPATGLYWEDQTVTVYKPQRGGVWYPRMFEMSDGTLICGFDTNEDGGNTVIKTVTSTDGGKTWSGGVTASRYPQYSCANAAFYQLDNGELWLAYRANQDINGKYYSSIRTVKSTDKGETWSDSSLVIEENGSGGVYEPIFGKIGNDIAVFYANDSLNVVSSGEHQNIEYKLWENGRWSDKHIASNGDSTNSRDGMPGLAKLSDGSYLLAIESTGMRATYPFVIQVKSSPDGLDWSSGLRTVYIPGKSGRKASGPFVLQLPDGRVALSFQTDDGMSKAGDSYSEMKIMVSTDASCSQFGEAFTPFNTPDGYCSVWNGLCLYDNQYLIAVSSTNYPSSQVVMRRASVN